MIIKDWIIDKVFSNITATINDTSTTLLKGTDIKFLLLTKYSEYTLLYDTKADNDNLYDSYVSYITPKLIDMYNMLDIANNYDVLTETITESVTNTYGKTDTNTQNRTTTNTGTQTTNNTGTQTDSATNSNTDTTMLSAYNTDTFDNSNKTTSSGTSGNTRTDNLQSQTTNNLQTQMTGGYTNTAGGTDTKAITKSLTNDGLYKDYINSRLRTINITLVNYFINRFIEISAYFIGDTME